MSAEDFMSSGTSRYGDYRLLDHGEECWIIYWVGLATDGINFSFNQGVVFRIDEKIVFEIKNSLELPEVVYNHFKSLPGFGPELTTEDLLRRCLPKEELDAYLFVHEIPKEALN